jgi:cysteine desulfuration protein SufE
MSLDTIRADFDLLDEWEDRYRYVIELGRELEPLEASAHTDSNKVRGCASQVWLVAIRSGVGDGTRLHFKGDSDAHIVRGLIAILFTIVNDRTPEDILAADIKGIFAELGLAENLTPQRSNGLASMIERIKSDARAAAASAAT